MGGFNAYRASTQAMAVLTRRSVLVAVLVVIFLALATLVGTDAAVAVQKQQQDADVSEKIAEERVNDDGSYAERKDIHEGEAKIALSDTTVQVANTKHSSGDVIGTNDTALIDPSSNGHSKSAVSVSTEEKKATIVDLDTPENLKRLVLEKKNNTGQSGASTNVNVGTGSSDIMTPQQPPASVSPQNSSKPPQQEQKRDKPNIPTSGFNYASLDAGAMIMANNPESQGTGNLLISDPDKYALSPCSAQQWFVVGLSEEILVTSIEVSNFEKYSSSAKKFQLWGAHKFPSVDEWVLIGELERPSHRGTETFALAKPSWARFVRFNTITVHGSEIYCTLSKIRVFGQTTMETLREDLQMSQQQMQAVKTSINDHKMAASVPSVLPTLGDSSEIDIDHDATLTTCLNTEATLKSIIASDILSISSTSPTKLQTDTENVNTALPASASQQTQGNHSQPATDATNVDTYALSLVNNKPILSSMDNIFKTLMEKVNGIEIDVSVLNACLQSNNDKVKSALEFLDKALKALKDDVVQLDNSRGANEWDNDRLLILETEMKSMSRRLAKLETTCFSLLFLAFWLWIRR